MPHGEVVETMTVAQLRDNTPTHPYTKRLLRASLGYDRSALAELDEAPARAGTLIPPFPGTSRVYR